MDFPGEEPFTLSCHHITPGRVDLRVLDQDRVWVDVRGVVHQLTSMNPTYRLNVLLFLREQAESLHLRVMEANTIERIYAMLTIQPGPPPTDPDVPSLEWLQSTALHRRLLELTDADGGR